ncbi:hypothetical protein BGZ65_004342 [Modicella reniformis]|uniref:E3 ubiquitin ligase complex SCF subunit n=1 Tax=Modicella reniformis TaxID=1440133 RepID=A0A9P6MBE8_9FUNG|nr:hypothetical protein BGZ65_004342 [Modicella reniformis]
MKVTLESSDGQVFTVDKEVAELSVIIKEMLVIEQANQDHPIPLLNVGAVELAKVIEYCEHHRNDPTIDDDEDYDSRKKPIEMDDWDKQFTIVNKEMMFELILAANSMQVKPLLHLGCRYAADIVKRMSPTEIRDLFQIDDDFTPEEQDKIEWEKQWTKL